MNETNDVNLELVFEADCAQAKKNRDEINQLAEEMRAQKAGSYNQLEENEDTKYYKQFMLGFDGVTDDDLYSIEKVSVLVGFLISEDDFFDLVESIRRNKPKKPMGYFFGGLRRKMPDIFEIMDRTTVIPQLEIKNAD